MKYKTEKFTIMTWIITSILVGLTIIDLRTIILWMAAFTIVIEEIKIIQMKQNMNDSLTPLFPVEK